MTHTTSYNPALKLLANGCKIQQWYTSGKTSSPVLVEVDPVNYCNASCPWCFYAKPERPLMLDTNAILSATKDMAAMGVSAINWTGGGEPTLHPDFPEMVQHTFDYGLQQGLFTNCLPGGNPANPQLFEWIRVSITDKGLNAVDNRLFAAYRDGTTVGICMNLTPENWDQCEENCLKAREMGAHYFQVRPALEQDYTRQRYVEAPIHINVHETDTFKVHIPTYKFADCMSPKGYSQCYGGWFTPVIDYRGDVRNCNYHLEDSARVIGNITTESFADIWARMPAHIEVTSDCQNCCKNHETNKVLASLRGLKHVNFI